MAEISEKDFEREYEATQHRPVSPPPPGPDWYDGYDHRLPPSRPPFQPPCPNCRPKSLEKYGFVPVVGGHYYTAGKSACCPVKVKITKITATMIYYEDKNGTPNEKSYHDFMTSSWKDRSL